MHLPSHPSAPPHHQWAGKTIALGTFPHAEAEEKCARAKALTRAWRSTMRPKPTREWVMLELERLGVRVVSGRLGGGREEGSGDDGSEGGGDGGKAAGNAGGVSGLLGGCKSRRFPGTCALTKLFVYSPITSQYRWAPWAR